MEPQPKKDSNFCIKKQRALSINPFDKESFKGSINDSYIQSNINKTE